MNVNPFSYLIEKRTLQKFTYGYALSPYTKVNGRYTLPAPTDHDYLFATVDDWSSGGLATSPFTVVFNKSASNTYCIVGSTEPLAVYVAYWYYE